jgi:sialate O-acetylesterase
MKQSRWMIRALALAALLPSLSEAKLELPRVFGDDMVVQRDKPLNVWGWGDKGDTVTVQFGGQTKTATVGDDGKWILTLSPLPVNAKPQELKVSGKTETLTFKNVLIGDVWLCSGQSNMESDAGGIINSDLDIPRANASGIRCLTIPLHSSPVPLDNFPIEERNPFYVELKGVWRVSDPTNTRAFTAIGYHFARIVHDITGVPIGLIDTSWGGSVVETWISQATLKTLPEAKPLIESFDAEVAAYNYEAELARKLPGWKRQVEKNEAAGKTPPPKPDVPKTYSCRQSFPGGCFNGLIAPIQRFAIKGVLFYQGENNSVGGQGRPNLYMKTYPALIPDWRKAFNDPALPFCIIQLSGFGEPVDENEPEDSMLHKASGVREAQVKAHLMYTNTALVCTYDLGHVQMHSPLKRPIGERSARWALADVYKVNGVEYNIPLLESWKKDGTCMLLTFTKGSNPSSPYGMRVPPKGFVIAGQDRHFYPAHVENVEGGKFSVSSEFVPDPVAVRYAWGVHPVGNFGNRAGLAAPFRTDDWPCWIDSGYRKDALADDPNAAQVPTPEGAKAQAWERKAAQARKVIEDYEAWKQAPKTQKKPR